MSPDPSDHDLVSGSSGSIDSTVANAQTRGGGWWTYRRPEVPGVASPGAGARPYDGGPARPVSNGAGGGGGGGPRDFASDGPVRLPRPEAPPRPVVDLNPPGVMPVALTVVGVVVLMMSIHFFPSALLSRILVPVTGLCAVLAIAPRLQRKHPDEPWLGRWMVYGVIVKELASILRYRTLVNSYGDVGDATVYSKAGLRYVGVWLGQAGASLPPPSGLRKSFFMHWFTGLVYFLFGSDMIAGFIVFALIAFAGSYLWYRAAAEALPFLDKRLFFLLVFFAPSVAFWPSSIGKEALMQFGIGSAALGTAHLLKGRLVRGLAVAAPGAWLLWVVRPHLLALVVLGAAGAYILGKSPRRAKSPVVQSSLVRPIGIIIVGFLTVFAVSQGANSLGLPSLTLGSVQAELDATTVSTGQGNSSFNNGGNSLSPVHLPQGFVTVVLRPFPWEVNSSLQILASLEGIALLGFMVYRRKSIAISLRRIRTSPFLFYCWTVTLLYAITFQAFANFGLLVRERSLVLPALYVLLCLDSGKAATEDEEREAEALSTSGADRAVV